MLRNIIAIVLGLVVAVAVIYAIEYFKIQAFPVLERIDINDQTQFATLPIGAFGFILGAWLAGTFTGGWVAARFAENRPQLCAGCVGVIILGAAIYELSARPHPGWITGSALVGIPLLTWLAGRLAESRRPRRRAM